MTEFDFAKIEKKWQKKWEDGKIFTVDEKSKKPKYYILEMFPYPSSSGLHMGHALNYSIGDVLARFKRMNGFEVLYPMGFDALGLPAENAAIKVNEHPKPFTENAINNYIRQMKALGLSYDWTKTLATMHPEYYKWNQYFFLKFLEAGLIYRKKAPVNWCPSCNTVISNEQAQGGICERCKSKIEIRHLDEWCLKTTNYADELIEGLERLDWPEKIKAMQRNWIGKSHGTEIDFEVEGKGNKISNVVIVHGANPKDREKIKKGFLPQNKRSWFSWIKKKLKGKNVTCFAPLMPENWAPKYQDWKKEFEKIKIDENSVLVGHSTGGAFLVRWLGETNRKIKKLILVAPAWSSETIPLDEPEFFRNFYGFEIDKKIKDRVKEIIIFVSDDERDTIKKSVEAYSKELNINPIILKKRGHFVQKTINEKMRFPELLKEIIRKNTWPIFTTRPDTIFGVTFMVVSAQHQRLNELVTEEQKEKVDKFLKSLSSVSEKEIESLEKEGVFTGSYAINPANGESIPIYTGNFVVADYGSGMVMAVPAHDQRDFKFAKKYGIEIKQVIAPCRVDKNNPHVDGKKVKVRNTVHAIIKDGKKVLCLKWKKQPWTTFVVGGVNEGESIVEAARREVLEETGYKNLSLEKIIPTMVRGEYFAKHKDENRVAYTTAVIFNLDNNKRDVVSKEEFEKHEAVWLNIKDINENNFTCAELDIWMNSLDGNSMRAYTDDGCLVNSDKFHGLNNIEAKEKITAWLKKQGKARKVVNYKLRDWGFSRQRYWGTPIPIIYCPKCGVVPVPEKDLPVVLPEDVKFGKGNPLTTNKKWINVKCPKCSGDGKRETETMDTFFDSSWYFLRYPDNKNDKKPFDKKIIKKWLPVDQYIGGAEHACMHLIYARFFTKALRDLKFLDFDEPFKALFNQGMLSGPDGDKMSKSKGNVINPDEISDKYGMDTARYFLLSLAAPDKPRDWSEKGIQGSLRFIKKIFGIFENIKFGKSSDNFVSKLNSTIKDIGEFYGNFKYRKATIKLKELFDLLAEQKEITKKDFEDSLKLLSPICPHISEELWEKLGNKNFISTTEWPKVDKSKIKKNGQVVNLNDKIVEKLKPIIEKYSDKKNIYLYVMPFEIGKINVEQIEQIIGKDVKIFAVNDSKKYDPEKKAKKAKPGKPGIYLE